MCTHLNRLCRHEGLQGYVGPHVAGGGRLDFRRGLGRVADLMPPSKYVTLLRQPRPQGLGVEQIVQYPVMRGREDLVFANSGVFGCAGYNSVDLVVVELAARRPRHAGTRGPG